MNSRDIKFRTVIIIITTTTTMAKMGDYTRPRHKLLLRYSCYQTTITVLVKRTSVVKLPTRVAVIRVRIIVIIII